MILSALFALQAILGPQGSVDPLAFFQPEVIVTAADRRRLDSGESIARILPARNLEVVVFAAVPVHVDGDRLVAWVRQIAELKKSSYVLAIGRFSDPPRLEDLAGLALDDEDLSAIRRCRPGDCALELSAADMRQLQGAADESGAAWKPALQQAFRQVVLQRVRTYLAGGQAALPSHDDEAQPVWPGSRLAALLGRSISLTQRLPRFAEYVSGYPRVQMPDVESFVYWSREQIASRAITSVTHVSVLRSTEVGLPDALVVGKEFFATRYVSGSLALTAIVRAPATAGTDHYLVYLNRSEADALGGMFGGVVRWFVQRRLRAEAADVLQGLRRRLESGEPDPMTTR
jgi:hypothetical protein